MPIVSLSRRIVVLIARAAFAPSGGGPIVWALHFLVIAAALFGLWWLNGWLGLDRAVHAPTRIVRELWAPILFSLGYALVWLTLWTWRAYSEPSAASAFPDIDSAWNEALAGARRAGIELTGRPLTLILGQPMGHDNDLISALGVDSVLGPLPARAEAPVRIVADESAIYVLSHDASLLSICSERLVQRRARRRNRRLAEQEVTAQAEASLPATLRVAGGDGTTAVAEAPTATTISAALEPSPEEPATSAPLFSPEDAGLAYGRLEHLLRLITRDREPVLPVESVAIVFPSDGVSDKPTTRNVTQAVRQDLQALDAAGVRCPVTAIGVDLQHLRGAGAMLHALPAERRGRHFGTTLPVDSMNCEQAARDTVHWIADAMTPALCSRLMQVEPDSAATLADNSALHRFENAMAQRGELVSDLVVAGLEGADGNAWPLAGVFFVATGDTLGGSQAFGDGLLEVAASRASHANWTPSALQADAQRRRFVSGGYATIAAAALLVVAGLVW